MCEIFKVKSGLRARLTAKSANLPLEQKFDILSGKPWQVQTPNNINESGGYDFEWISAAS